MKRNDEVKTLLQKRIKALRENMDLTQREYAEALGVSRSTIKGWEAGVNKPEADMLEKMADLHHVPIDFIFGRDSLKYLYVAELPEEVAMILTNLISTIEKMMADQKTV